MPSTQTFANASTPPNEARSESTSSVIHPPSQPGGMSGHVPQADKDKNVKVLADESSNKTSVPDQSVVSEAFVISSRAIDESAEREIQRQEEKKRRVKEIQVAKRKYAMARNLEAYEGVRRRYMLPSGEPILKILKDKVTVAVGKEEEDTTEYDTDEDGGRVGEGEDQEVVAQMYSDFVLAVGINEPLDAAGQKIVSTYLGTYLLSRLEYARARHFDMRSMRSNMAEKTMLWVQNQKRVPESWTWSSQKWNREMNEAIRHHKKTDAHWNKRMVVLEERLAKSWKENVEGARRELQSTTE
ncbi:hypothetical protein BGZ95_004958 [Linnemannia exigua]|uniref:Uncharacterized protein n=1 Tax=Linnemannia exigua TaxID=604196 RepID=A0AAD4DLI4_9FUNG|nr:hypothetical protein BGZ95_004958 [Linnemannia exigua]